MAKLSPAAQAVAKAALKASSFCKDETCPYRGEEIAAAVLRTVADQLLPVCSTQTDNGMQRMAIRNDLLVIAEELETQ